jgi:hypothetical protein
MKESDFNIKEEIQLAAEAIFSALYHDGDTDLQDLQERVNWKSPVFDWALGWLVGKEDVEVIPANGTFRLKRAAPAPAVFPLRGN